MPALFKPLFTTKKGRGVKIISFNSNKKNMLSKRARVPYNGMKEKLHDSKKSLLTWESVVAMMDIAP